MRPLSAAGLLRLWETTQALRPIDRALRILGAVCPDTTVEQLALLPLRERDTLLLALREQLFGRSLACFVRCTQCTAALEFTIDSALLRAELDGARPDRAELTVRESGYEIVARLPTSDDLAAAAAHDTHDLARRRLLECCVVSATYEGAVCPPADLPAAALDALVPAMIVHDPGAELTFDLTCASCGYAWEAELDVAQYLWVELAALAKRLLREVSALALRYGWREMDILRMTAARRAAYLELAL